MTNLSTVSLVLGAILSVIAHQITLVSALEDAYDSVRVTLLSEDDAPRAQDGVNAHATPITITAPGIYNYPTQSHNFTGTVLVYAEDYASLATPNIKTLSDEHDLMGAIVLYETRRSVITYFELRRVVNALAREGCAAVLFRRSKYVLSVDYDDDDDDDDDDNNGSVQRLAVYMFNTVAYRKQATIAALSDEQAAQIAAAVSNGTRARIEYLPRDKNYYSLQKIHLTYYYDILDVGTHAFLELFDVLQSRDRVFEGRYTLDVRYLQDVHANGSAHAHSDSDCFVLGQRNHSFCARSTDEFTGVARVQANFIINGLLRTLFEPSAYVRQALRAAKECLTIRLMDDKPRETWLWLLPIDSPYGLVDCVTRKLQSYAASIGDTQSVLQGVIPSNYELLQNYLQSRDVYNTFEYDLDREVLLRANVTTAHTPVLFVNGVRYEGRFDDPEGIVLHLCAQYEHAPPECARFVHCDAPYTCKLTRNAYDDLVKAGVKMPPRKRFDYWPYIVILFAVVWYITVSQKQKNKNKNRSGCVVERREQDEKIE